MRWLSVVQGAVVASVAAATFAVVSNQSVEGQQRTPAIPRVGGHPDLNGLWQAVNTANWDIQAHSAKAALAMRPGPVVPVPAKEVIAMGAAGSIPSGAGVVDGDELPYTAEGLKKKQDNQANWLTRDPEVKCYLPGVPRATYMPFPFQITQSNYATFIAYEYAGAVRHIYMKDPGPPQVDSWMGLSHGRWEGDTFVVDTVGFSEGFWIDRGQLPHTSQLHLTEKYTRTALDSMKYELTIDDPGAYTSQFTGTSSLRWQDGTELFEYVCQQGNEAPQLMVGGDDRTKVDRTTLIVP